MSTTASEGVEGARATRLREALPPLASDWLSAIVETAADGIVICDVQGHVVDWNAAAAHLFGYDLAEVRGLALGDLVPMFSRRRATLPVGLADHATSALRGEQIRTLGVRRDSETLPIELTLAAWTVQEGQFLSIFVRDITARKRAEWALRAANEELARREDLLRRTLRRLRRSHATLKATQIKLVNAAKMESVGRLAAGVAHEVKNPLAIVRLGTDYLRSRLESQSANRDVVDVLTDVSDAVTRADTVVKELLQFSAPRELELAPRRISELVEHVLGLVRFAREKNHVELVTRLDPSVEPVRVDADKLTQALLNILMNAIDAMPEGGTLSVSTRPAGGEGRVEIAVADTGHGIPEGSLTQVFDPFFTSKPLGKGTGLGLSVTKTIVELHGGYLQIENRDTGGVLATIVLPLERRPDHGESSDSRGG
jgi:PAS domain S-box-containing protein